MAGGEGNDEFGDLPFWTLDELFFVNENNNQYYQFIINHNLTMMKCEMRMNLRL